MARLRKHDWLIAGLSFIAERGVAALTIENVTAALGVTKGSFYHHFKSFADYKTALLVFFEQEGTLDIIQSVEQDAAPTARLTRLFEIASSYAPALEIEVRTWALQDDEVRRVQARIDAQRMGYLSELCTEIVGDTTRATIMAQLAYTILVGSMHVQPPLPLQARRRLFDEFRQLYQIK